MPARSHSSSYCGHGYVREGNYPSDYWGVNFESSRNGQVDGQFVHIHTYFHVRFFQGVWVQSSEHTSDRYCASH